MIMSVHTHQEAGDGLEMRTNIEIDDDLMREALAVSGLRTKRSVVEAALQLLIQRKAQERIRELRGRLEWSGDLDQMRRDR
jgi:Arc/MetJ family transcription regulator